LFQTKLVMMANKASQRDAKTALRSGFVTSAGGVNSIKPNGRIQNKRSNILKKKLMLLMLLFVTSIMTTAYASEAPKCTQDDMWEFVVNNAYRVADKYATDRNPRSTFVSFKNNYKFNKQYAGEHEGKYLLMLTNKHGRDTSFAVLLPLFDVNKPSKGLNDNNPLWKVINAKLNGQRY